MTEQYDVVAVSFDTYRVRILAEDKDYLNAEAVVRMAIMRRGVVNEMYVSVPAGTYKDGDVWQGYQRKVTT